MPRSPRTYQLHANAHKMGDEYYRYLESNCQSETVENDECIERAKTYMQALETLRSHLLTLDFDDPHVAGLIQTTEGHISLVQTDLLHFQNARSVSP